MLKCNKKDLVCQGNLCQKLGNSVHYGLKSCIFVEVDVLFGIGRKISEASTQVPDDQEKLTKARLLQEL